MDLILGSSEDSARVAELEELVSSLKNEKFSLESRISQLSEEVSEGKEKYSKESGYSRSLEKKVEELEEKLSDGISKEDVAKRIDSAVASISSEKFRLEQEVSSYKAKAVELSKQLTEAQKLQKTVASLDTQLAKERSNVVELNRKLLQSNYSGTVNQQEVINIPTSLMQPVVGSLINRQTKFKNIRFLFAGSGDSHREAYLYAEKVLTENVNGGIFYDLSTESVADYRFGVKRGHEVGSWYSDSYDSLKKYLSHTKYSNVYVLGTFKGSVNELFTYSLDLYSRLEYLDSLGVSVVIYGGDISSYFSRDLFSSVSNLGLVDVVCRSLGTSARSMYYNSKMVSGSKSAVYYLSGKVDEMSSKVAKIAIEEGYDWRGLDA